MLGLNNSRKILFTGKFRNHINKKKRKSLFLVFIYIIIIDYSNISSLFYRNKTNHFFPAYSNKPDKLTQAAARLPISRLFRSCSARR